VASAHYRTRRASRVARSRSVAHISSEGTDNLSSRNYMAANDCEERVDVKPIGRFLPARVLPPMVLRAMGVGVVAVYLLAPMNSGSAAEVQAGGVSFELPSDWIPVDGSPTGGGGGFVGAWTKEREGVVLGNLTVATRSSYSSVQKARIESGKRMLRSTLRAAPEIRDFELKDLQVVELDRAPAYRVRASLAASGTRVEQLQYVVSGAGTVALTFSWNGERYREAEEDCEGIASSVRVLERPSLLAEMPVWMCGGALGMFAGLCAAARRGRTGRGGATPPERRKD